MGDWKAKGRQDWQPVIRSPNCVTRSTLITDCRFLSLLFTAVNRRANPMIELKGGRLPAHHRLRARRQRSRSRISECALPSRSGRAHACGTHGLPRHSRNRSRQAVHRQCRRHVLDRGASHDFFFEFSVFICLLICCRLIFLILKKSAPVASLLLTVNGSTLST